METSSPTALGKNQHPGPSLGFLALVFMILFNLGLFFVVSFTSTDYYPRPWGPDERISTYFNAHPNDVLWCAFFQFGSAIPLGLFTATVSSRLEFLGVRAAGTRIALFGGFFAAFNLALSAMMLWVMSYPGIAGDPGVLRALYSLVFAIGGVGYSVPLGLLIAGISVTSFFQKLLPRWLCFCGLALAVIGELSFISLILHEALFLIPLTRFPGFIWLIVVGFLLPKSQRLGEGIPSA